MLFESNTVKDCCLSTLKDTWLNTETSFPSFLPVYSKEVQAQNQTYLNTFSTRFQKHLAHFPRTFWGRKRWKKQTMKLVITALSEETILGLHGVVSTDTMSSFQQELTDFLIQVRQFAPELSFESIGQAIRNYVVYMMFKELHQEKSGFNKAAFGYSMLYPFTDNYIDSSCYSPEEKKAYNKLIQDKISGLLVTPSSPHHEKTCDLLQSIEEEYEREKDSSVFTLLLMMLEAQDDSMRQQKSLHPLTLLERMDISLYKGGISVLIDRFFVKQELTETDLIFYLHFGYFLQLADDLQDIKEDTAQGNQTIFTFDLSSSSIEKITNQMLHFIHHIITNYSSKQEPFKEFILANCYQLIFTSVSGSKEFFSKEYLLKLSSFLPVSTSFIDQYKQTKLTKKESSVQQKYMYILDNMLLS